MRLLALFICMGLGALGLWAIYPVISSNTIPAGYYDLSAMPDEIEVKFQDPQFLERIVKQELVIQERLAQMEASAHVTLPDGVPAFPFGKLYAPKATTHWPSLTEDTARTVLEAAKTDWVILNIWATWCAPCIKELPDMQTAAPKLRERGVRLIAVNADPTRKDTPADIEAVFADRGINSLPSIFTEDPDLKAILDATGQENVGFPTNLVFAPGGEPFGYFIGLPEMDEVWNTDPMLDFFGALAASDAN